MASLRGHQQPDLSKKLYRLIKTENHAIGAYEAAAKEQANIASQLSDWGEETGDDAISEISDKLGVLLAEIAEQEDVLASGLEESRGVLKQIRNTESSVQPSRDQKAKIADEIQKLKYKEPSSVKIVTLEQELVRAEAQSLVAEAQLTNITRQKFKEAYDLHTAAIIERAEKQILLAKNARKLLNLVDDTPIVPGDVHPTFSHAETAREVLNVAEDELRAWTPNVEPIHTNAGNLGTNAMPAAPVSSQGAAPTQHYAQQSEYPTQHSEHLTQQSEYPTQQSEYTQHADQYATSSEPSVVGQEPVAYQTQTSAQPTETSYATDEHDHEHARSVASRVLG
ncbi:hypothetical protein M436DRAFT_50799 [Aureobasidium namibiae CBS 147.97]|uniref:Sphingolipid long chain base-responsive protein LSP1 n=1 Tax=Aureobasidium namibiae CBS 147.97 TaxID=1043004 RepID=A0A074WJ84_9PEZI|nr:uncharacterized protein M436DRAFT_50799 [Aureobasidium namibiae CBS 147.97]KEQ71654.1 hypothetical protein M436DRAFT_50799 [Aureobasidium namibiae CBS 147.97]